MDGDSWSPRLPFPPKDLPFPPKRYQSALQSRSDMFMGFEEFDGDYDIREEFPCPFCSEFFDILGLCGHIDEEHQLEARNGVCPVCAMRVGFDMVAHITLQHGNILKRKRKSRKGGSHSTLSLLRRELREGTLQSLLGGSSSMFSSTNVAPDPLLSSFISPVAGNLSSSQPSLQTETSSAKKNLNENVAESHSQALPLSDKDREERAKRCEFASELLWSTIIDDNL